MPSYIFKKQFGVVVGSRGRYRTQAGAETAARGLADQLGMQLVVEEHAWVPGNDLGVLYMDPRGVGVTHAWKAGKNGGWSEFSSYVNWSYDTRKRVPSELRGAKWAEGTHLAISAPIWREWGPASPKPRGREISLDSFERRSTPTGKYGEKGVTPKEIARLLAPITSAES